MNKQSAPRHAANGIPAAAAPAFALEVDGSTQYLGVKVPQGAHPLRADALELLRAGGFQLDALSRVWRLRGRHEVLLFLSTHGGTLRRRFNAKFTPEFQVRTACLATARLVASTESHAAAITTATKTTTTAKTTGTTKANATTAVTPPSASSSSAAASSVQSSARAAASQSSTAAAASPSPAAAPAAAASSFAPVAPEHELVIRIEAPGAAETDVHAALLRGQPYVEARNGKIILFPKEVLETAANLARALSPASVGIGGDAIAPAARLSHRVRPESFAEIENLLAANAVAFTPPAVWRERSAALRNLSALREAPVPPACYEQLRLYQKIGAAWLWHLRRHGLGGILADEMGLGKTVQALALLAAVHAAEPRASFLVVCPASLVENWCREAARFAPGVPLARHYGTARAAAAAELPAAGIIVTSYGTLARDTALLASRHWDTVLADEAQHAKNRHSQNARSLRALPAAARFVLTGTPVENSVEDLRSLFDFLMPGHIERPPAGDKRGDVRAHWDARTIAQAAPYVLRRAKADVAPELPPKIEQTVFIPLEDAQRRLYDELRDRTRREIFEMEMSGSGDAALRIRALNHLLRLRQACAEPRLLDPSLAAADSAKLQALREILDEAQDGGHRVLVFSQFVEVLRHIRAALDEWGVAHCYLDGSTRDRQAVCDRFNNAAPGELPVFLISLKAGGVGLNLAAADTVVHFDPWWNPAVEAQATDRAHRIGQTRRVTSLRLIASGTVEERVLELQREKSVLLEALFADAAASAPLTLETLKELLG